MNENLTSSKPKDSWASGEDYERYVGRWSRLVAREFLAWLAIPAGSQWLDVGCGTGALSQTILQFAEPVKIKGIDRSESFVALARVNIQDERVQFEVGDAEALTAESGAFDAAVSGLVLNFVPQPDRAVAEMRRVTRSGGVVAAYVWDYAGGMQMMRHFWDAAIALDPGASELDQARRFPICHPEALSRLFESTGLQHVEVRPIEISTLFRDFDDYWSPFLAGQGPAPSYVVSLREERRVALREQIRAGLPVAPDGSIPLVSQAWAVRGVP
jgi:SAM-dependent methyltransferase